MSLRRHLDLQCHFGASRSSEARLSSTPLSHPPQMMSGHLQSSILISMSLRQDVRGIDLDSQTRCVHYNSQLDIIAIRVKCCGVYYACKDCHDALAGHVLEVWPRSEWNQPAVLCGACGVELSIRQYLDCGNVCPKCRTGFNPGCRNHYHYYFEMAEATIQKN
jgi:uncharacterized CHY-type Zn-finger protein